MGLLEYSLSISLKTAKQVMQVAEAEASANNWAMAIVIVDCGGHLVAMQKMDHAILGAIEVAHTKARTAVLFKRPTKIYEEAVGNAFPGARLLSNHEICPFEGGVPLIRDGKVIGAIGVSGAQSNQDGQVAIAGSLAITC
jgi:glc operon protein GlcG